MATTSIVPRIAHAEPRDAGADYEPPSWMKERRAEERSQAAWRAQVRAASVQGIAGSSKARKASGKAPDISPAASAQPEFVHPVVVLPQGGDPSVQALRLQAAQDAVDRARLRKAAAQRRAAGENKGAQTQRQRLEAAQQSRRHDEGRLEAAEESRRQDQRAADAAQRSRRDDEARLEAAQQSRRDDQSRLEAAQQSRREDQARLEAAQAERQRQH